MRRVWPTQRAFLCGILLWATFVAADRSSAVENPSDRSEIEAIRQASQAYLEAAQRGDHRALQNFWTPEGDFVDESGQKFKPYGDPRDPGEREPANAPSKIASGQRLKVRVESIKLITPDVAIEDGTSEISPAPAGRTAQGRFTAVWVKRQGKWLINSVREAAMPIPLRQQKLEELAWMVGDWVETGDAAAVQAKCRWSADKNFLLREIQIQPKDREAHVVMQRIGWDPASGKIRSWVFDSHGGFGEGTWTHEGDRWVVKSTSTLPDGKHATGTTVNARVGEDAFLWESLDYSVEGQTMPDLRVKLIRKEISK